MKLGLNLSFAVKRWYDPQKAADMIKSDFRIDDVQFTWDLINPWWPQKRRDKIAREWKNAFADHAIELNGTFGGLAAYTYPQLLAPTENEREISLEFFKKAIDLTSVMEAESIGTPLGGMTYQDAKNPKRRDYIYKRTLEDLEKLAAYAKKRGLKKIIIEPTPLATEFPSTPEESLKLMKDLEGKTEIPVLLLIDWGHALFEPLLGKKADMDLWIDTLADYLDCMHLQQTDGQLDRHWDFTGEGMLSKDLIEEIIARNNVQHLTQYIELIYAFEERDDKVYESVKNSIKYLRG